MIYTIFFILCLVFLTIISVVDLKTYNKKDGYIPSALTTFFVLVTFIFGIMFIEQTLILSILGLLIGLLLFDLKEFDGLADLKIFVGISILLSDFFLLVVFSLFVVLCSSIVKRFLKKKKFSEMPYIPFLTGYLIVYSLIMLGISLI